MISIAFFLALCYAYLAFTVFRWAIKSDAEKTEKKIAVFYLAVPLIFIAIICTMIGLTEIK